MNADAGTTNAGTTGATTKCERVSRNHRNAAKANDSGSHES
jgi:hypothetical protein